MTEVTLVIHMIISVVHTIIMPRITLVAIKALLWLTLILAVVKVMQAFADIIYLSIISVIETKRNKKLLDK